MGHLGNLRKRLGPYANAGRVTGNCRAMDAAGECSPKIKKSRTATKNVMPSVPNASVQAPRDAVGPTGATEGHWSFLCAVAGHHKRTEIVSAVFR